MAQSDPASETTPSGKPKRRPGANRRSNKMDDHQDSIHANEGSKRKSNKQRYMSSDDERFTENAAKERRDMSSDSEDLSQTPKSGTLQSVQVPKVHPKNASTSRSLQSQIMSTDSSFDPHAESPDELQGEATTQPVPAVLLSGRKKNASNGSNLGAEKAACQRSSPTDIKSTEFSPTTAQGNRVRKKARKKAQNRWSFQALLVQDGNIQLRHSDDDGKSIAVHFDKSKGILEFAADTTDSSHQFSFPLKRVVQIIQGNDPSCKLRFNLSKMESPVGPVGPIDIELSSTEEKNNLCGLFRDVSIQYKDRYAHLPLGLDTSNDAYICLANLWMVRSKRPRGTCPSMPTNINALVLRAFLSRLLSQRLKWWLSVKKSLIRLKLVTKARNPRLIPIKIVPRLLFRLRILTRPLIMTPLIMTFMVILREKASVLQQRFP